MYTITDFDQDFPDEEACIKKIFNERYGSIQLCPNCKKAANFHRLKNRKCFACQFCGYQIHPLAGTIFHKSSTPLKLWFYAIFLLSVPHTDISVKELQERLLVTYKTAWRIAKQVRPLMNEGLI